MWCFVQYTQEYARLSRLSQSWQSMKQKINVGQELAEKTLAYWQTAPLRVLVCIKWSSLHQQQLNQLCCYNSILKLVIVERYNVTSIVFCQSVYHITRRHGVQLPAPSSASIPRGIVPTSRRCRIMATSSVCRPTAAGRTASPAQLLWPTGFLCGWSVGLEFPAGQLA